MQHASVAARYQLGGMAGGALVGYGTTGSIDGALMGASFGQMGGSIAAHFAVACFTAGTPLVVDMEGNSRPIDEIEVGDFVLARSEFDPDGPLELKRVEEKFVRTSVVMELVVHGQSIKTTAEHPFFVPVQGKFVAAGELQVGEQLVGHDGKLVQIESIGSKGEVTTVYNLRVADFHTYFVGGGLWGFDVWVHNASYYNASLRVNSPQQVADLRQAFNSSDKTAFIKNWAANSKQAKRLLAPDELAFAARKGTLPDHLVVHHLVPLYRGGTNSFENLRVMRQSFHHKFREYLHNYPVNNHPYASAGIGRK